MKDIKSFETISPVSTSHHAMGTVMTHSVFGPNAAEALTAVRREIKRLEDLFSRFLPDSDISRINRAAGKNFELVSPETIDLLTTALSFFHRFPGCFDVTIAPLVSLWATGKASYSQPAAAGIEQALALVDGIDLVLDHYGQKAALKRPGQAIDLGGIAKGYSADKLLDIFKAFGTTSAFSNLGGNVVTMGAKPNGQPWRVGIQHPREENGLIGSVAVVDQTVVTSGDYRRFFTDRQGNKHHHILDPTTGYPARSDLISVTIVTRSSLVADAMATIVFIAGIEKGMAILKHFPEIEAVLVDSDMNIHISSDLKHRFQPAEGIRMTTIN